MFPQASRLERCILAASLVIFVAGLVTANHLACTSAAVCLILVIHRLYADWKRRRVSRPAVYASAPTEKITRNRLRPATAPTIPPQNSAAFVREMIFQGRYAVLMRPEVAKNLTREQREDVARAAQEEMSLVCGGRISATEPDEVSPEAWAQSLFMDRYAVSNLEFQEFVNAGGYGIPELWVAEARESLSCLVDLTGKPGPRYWRDGTFTPGTAHLPVVGVSWYEADAYARWSGKRLPNSTEWIRAALGVHASPRPGYQPTRYPWGNMFREDRANLWGAGRGQPVPVEEYPSGQTPTGVRQMVGNVWEWMDDELARSFTRGKLTGRSATMKVLRGGAFNTYFESQAACDSASGDDPLARKDNIGFRCVITAKDTDPAMTPVACSA